MSAALKQAPIGRAEFVRGQVLMFTQYAIAELSIDHFRNFAQSCEKLAHHASRIMTAHLGDDVNALTDHAARVRTLSAHVVLLRDGLVPALEIDWDNQNLRQQAAYSMGLIRAECAAMENIIV
jgi:hypothetical protein